MFFAVLLLVSACNEPLLYNKHAREFLVSQGEPATLIEQLTRQQTIDAADASRLAAYDNRAVLHLVRKYLGWNPAYQQWKAAPGS